MKKSRKITIIFLISLLSLIYPDHSLVHADIAPPPAPGIGALEPFEYQKTEVQMVYERVEMELREVPDADWPLYHVDVSAWFVMHNHGAGMLVEQPNHNGANTPAQLATIGISFLGGVVLAGIVFYLITGRK
jgi:hypothetical protein